MKKAALMIALIIMFVTQTLSQGCIVSLNTSDGKPVDFYIKTRNDSLASRGGRLSIDQSILSRNANETILIQYSNPLVVKIYEIPSTLKGQLRLKELCGRSFVLKRRVVR